jgi:hypothetical protein
MCWTLGCTKYYVHPCLILFFCHPQFSVSLFLPKDFLCYTSLYSHLSCFLPCGFSWYTLSHPSDFIKKLLAPISVFLVLYKPATSPCGWKPEWKKRGHSKNNHTYTNTLTYGAVTLLSSNDPCRGGTADWRIEVSLLVASVFMGLSNTAWIPLLKLIGIS